MQEKRFDIPNFQQHFDSSYIDRFSMLIILHVVKWLRIRWGDVRCNNNNFTVIIRLSLCLSLPLTAHAVQSSAAQQQYPSKSSFDVSLVFYIFFAHTNEIQIAGRILFNVRTFRVFKIPIRTNSRSEHSSQHRSGEKLVSLSLSGTICT